MSLDLELLFPVPKDKAFDMSLSEELQAYNFKSSRLISKFFELMFHDLYFSYMTTDEQFGF